MNRAQATAERAAPLDRVQFLDAIIEALKPAPINPPYACQAYDKARPCEYDRRRIDRKCDGCQRPSGMQAKP